MDNALCYQIANDLIIAICCFLSIPLIFRWSKVLWTATWRIMFPVKTLTIIHTLANGNEVKRTIDLSSKKSLIEQLERRGDTK